MSHLKKALQLSTVILFICSLLYCGKGSVKSTHDTQSDHFKSAVEMVSAIKQGRTTSVELLNLHLDRIQRYNDDINAIVAMNIDDARQRAAEADRAIEEGRDWGLLHGLPMTVKDVFEVVGMPATSGDPKLKGYIPDHNAIAVQRLIDAGAVIFGKTNVPYHASDIQSYNEIYGTTNNPWDLSRTPGGSSGGSAAALAAGLTPLELGSDIGGSVRNPAHYTGVFGHKPTIGVVPRYGHIPPMPGQVPPEVMPAVPLFVVGPLARSAEDFYHVIGDQDGLFGCMTLLGCQDNCPKDLPHMQQIARLCKQGGGGIPLPGGGFLDSSNWIPTSPLKQCPFLFESVSPALFIFQLTDCYSKDSHFAH